MEKKLAELDKLKDAADAQTKAAEAQTKAADAQIKAAGIAGSPPNRSNGPSPVKG